MQQELDLPFPIFPTRSRLYRQFFTPNEIRRLDAIPCDSLVSEIHALRLLLRRVLAASSKMRLTLKHRLEMLSAFCQAALSLAAFVRFEFKQQPEPPDLLDLFYPGALDESEI